MQDANTASQFHAFVRIIVKIFRKIYVPESVAKNFNPYSARGELTDKFYQRLARAITAAITAFRGEWYSK